MSVGGAALDEMRAQEIDLAANTLALEAQRQAAPLKRRINAQAPVSRLPDEILVYIFHVLIMDSVRLDLAYPVEILLCLGSVYSRWWQLVLSQDTLWSHVHDTDPSYLVAVRKSRGALLRINYLGDLPVRSFLDSIEAERERWCSVRFSPWQHLEDLHRHSPSLYGPNLHTLVLQALAMEESDGRVVEVNSASPLRHLETHFIDVRFLGDALPTLTLTTLHLERFSCTPVMYNLILHLITTSSGTLRKLFLAPSFATDEEEGAVEQWTDQYYQPGTLVLRLPHLAELTLIDIPPTLCDVVLHGLGEGLDSLQRVTLHLREPREETWALLSHQSQHPLTLALNRICERLVSLWLWSSPDSISGAVQCTSFEDETKRPGQGEWLFDILMHTETGLEMLQTHHLSFLQTSKAPPLTAYFSPDDLRDCEEVTLRRIALATPSLCTLGLIGGELPTGILTALSETFVNEDKTDLCWVWPGLRRIVVDNLSHLPDGQLQSLAAVSKARHELGNEGDNGHTVVIFDALGAQLDWDGAIHNQGQYFGS